MKAYVEGDQVRVNVQDIGSDTLRSWFAEIPLEERVALGRDVLRMYAGRKDQDELLMKRFQTWERGGQLALTELPLVTLVQLSKGWSDEDIMRTAIHGL